MQYFLPFWPADDIYVDFNPWKARARGARAWKGKELRIWEVYPKPPIDGVLVSLVNIQRNKKLRETSEKDGIHKALRFNGPVMGDCGAFSYINESETPDPLETLETYRKLGFDIGVTVDHLIVNTILEPKPEIGENGKQVIKKIKRKLTKKEKEERWNLTLNNAEEMFNKSLEKKYENLRLIGVTQGLNHTSYGLGVKKLLDIGYDYVGLGGLARKPTNYIINVLEKVTQQIKREIKRRGKRYKLPVKIGLHLFGLGRQNFLGNMIQYGVSSFDSASLLRTSWLSSEKNYLLDEDFYTAIRIPYAQSETEKAQEKELFEKLKLFEEGRNTSKNILLYIKEYDPERTTLRGNKYEQTLTEKPWKQCDGPICKELGIHVCIMRGNERNMRRGFHNVYQFHKTIRKHIPRILTMTWCTGKKVTDRGLIPAFLRYAASNIFRNFWNKVYDLPVEIDILSAKYGLISWDTRIPWYEERLTQEKIPNLIKDLKRQFIFYDKIFFIGLGIYKEAIELVANDIDTPIEIFPKIELSNRNKLDIIEYNKQMVLFREAIKTEVKPLVNIQKKLEY